eukprot:m.14453 g.14453  ORF g.14453 m.14453 type:complete len:81 (-) comp7621_c0_seq1:1121-1363(-)
MKWANNRSSKESKVVLLMGMTAMFSVVGGQAALCFRIFQLGSNAEDLNTKTFADIQANLGAIDTQADEPKQAGEKHKVLA